METNNSRSAILEAIRLGKPKPFALPEMPNYSFTGDLKNNFINQLKKFDGQCREFESRQEALEFISQLDKSGKNSFSSIPEFRGNKQLSDFVKAHDAHIIDICISEALFGVAETGSVWVTDQSLQLAAAALFSTDLYLLLNKEKLVGNMHDAYRQIDFKSCQYGSFFTGPSATADIEAIHITGAQGEISLTVLLY